MFFLPKILIFTGAFFLFSGSLAHASGPVAAKVELQLVVPEVGALGGEAVTPVPLVLPERAQNGFLDGIVPGVPAKPLLATVLAGADDTGAALPEFHPAPLPMADDDDRLRLGKEANLKRRDYSVDIASNCSDVSSRSACWEAIFTYSRAGRDECSVMLTFVITTL